MPQGVLDQERAEGIADPYGVGDVALLRVQGEDGVAEPDHR
ncbi:hypothetical protein OG323_01840 [Streptomyces cyaneofuscatus]|nr:hypothetical protein OG323_01840 [Streptomyces cyaneofuscatus]